MEPKTKRKATSKPVHKIPVAGSKRQGVKAPFPANIRPMLATLVDRPFDREGWMYEVKWDGYRALALLNKGEVNLKSRNDKSFNEKFYPVYDALSKLKLNAVLDGEIVVLDEKGLSSFGALQNWRSEADGQLVYYLFDILWLDGYDLTGLPLTGRRKILESTIAASDMIRVSQYFRHSGTAFFEAARSIGMEGIIAKAEESLYHAGDRSTEWLKIKANKRQEVVIGGFTNNEGSSKVFSALLVGVFDKGRFHYTGKIGTGFNEQLQREMMKQFKPLITSKPPFHELPDINKPSRFRPNPPHATATWLKPQLVCEVSYAELTSDGIMRHPSFEGMRTDKNAKEVVLESEAATPEAIKEHKALVKSKTIRPAKKERKTLLNPSEETQVKTIHGHALTFTNLSKVYWTKERVTKRDMINYYYQAAPYMLPYLLDRPHTLNRHPNGISGKSFYQKDITGKVPGWIEGFPYYSEMEAQQKNFLVCKDEASLLYMASLGCIEINPWSSRIQLPDHPDWCIIDLDPDKNSFNQVVEAAQVTKSILDSIKVPSVCKTSGSTGLHIYIPLGAKYTYEQSKEFARVIARMVQQQLPRFTSIERTIADRKGKMYIDFLQNRPQATIAAPYSLRPKPGATVSMPLRWEEVKKGLQIRDFTIFNAMERLQSEGDLFKAVLGKGINMEQAIRRIEKL